MKSFNQHPVQITVHFANPASGRAGEKTFLSETQAKSYERSLMNLGYYTVCESSQAKHVH